VVDYAADAAGTVLDLAAAPGGKALALAAAVPDRYVAAADLSLTRIGRLRQNVQRLGRPAPAGLGDVGVGIVVADARRPPFRMAPLVLLDAPCTGTGTLRRHPDGRWRVQPEDLAALTALQRELLDAAATVVAPGGLLVYSTCSLEPEENEAQVESLLERNAEFELETTENVARELTDAAGHLRVLPQALGVDGAFAARLRRRAR
jgi:16S rRNA (cytosine967-C5)-methyltransferase